MRPARHRAIMGHHDYCVASLGQGLQQIQDFSALFGVYRSCRFVREDDPGAVDQRPGDGDSLLFATGQFRRTVIEAVAETECLQDLLRPAMPLPRPKPGIGRRQFDVGHRGQRLQQVVGLEHEAEGVAPQDGKTVVVEGADVDLGDPALPVCGTVQAADDVHERGLAAPRRTGDADELASVDAQRDSVQGAYRVPVFLFEHPADAGQFDQRRRAGTVHRFWRHDRLSNPSGAGIVSVSTQTSQASPYRSWSSSRISVAVSVTRAWLWTATRK